MLMLAMLLACRGSVAFSADVLDRIKPALVKEPKYVSQPGYALLVLGAKAESQVWLVEDGKTLYVDKNANGDLTDDGPPIEPSNVRSWKSPEGKTHGDFDYLLDVITPPDGSRHTDMWLGRFNYGDPEDRYAFSFKLNGATPMYAGWFGPFFTSSPATAQRFHFGGPLTPRKLRGKDFVIGSPGRLSICFVNPGRGEGATTRLSIRAIPPEIVPTVDIDWPAAEGATAIHTSHRLTERCCYWEFYSPDVAVPEGVVRGTATLTISLPPAAMPLELTTNKLEVPVRPPQAGSALE
jgi:hypothetical protein